MKKFKVIIEKELLNPNPVNCEIEGPYYHLYLQDELGKHKVRTVTSGDIKDAARAAEQLLDITAMEVAYEENPNSFKSTINSSTPILGFDMIDIPFGGTCENVDWKAFHDKCHWYVVAFKNMDVKWKSFDFDDTTKVGFIGPNDAYMLSKTVSELTKEFNG